MRRLTLLITLSLALFFLLGSIASDTDYVGEATSAQKISLGFEIRSLTYTECGTDTSRFSLWRNKSTGWEKVMPAGETPSDSQFVCPPGFTWNLPAVPNASVLCWEPSSGGSRIIIAWGN